MWGHMSRLIFNLYLYGGERARDQFQTSPGADAMLRNSFGFPPFVSLTFGSVTSVWRGGTQWQGDANPFVKLGVNFGTMISLIPIGLAGDRNGAKIPRYVNK